MSEIRKVYIKVREIGIWTCPKCLQENIDSCPQQICSIIKCGYCHFETAHFEVEKYDDTTS